MQYRVGTCASCNATFKVPATFPADKAKCKSCEDGVVEIGPPVDEPELLRAELTWPQLATGDDDGNGHLDLFAMWRFGTLVFRGRPDAGGIASKPTRRMLFKPLSWPRWQAALSHPPHAVR